MEKPKSVKITWTTATEAERMFDRLIEDTDEPGADMPKGMFIWQDKTGDGRSVWTAMDNEDGYAWVDDFATEAEAIRWLLGHGGSGKRFNALVGSVVKVIYRDNREICVFYENVKRIVDMFDDNGNYCHQLRMANGTATFPACEWEICKLDWVPAF